MHIEGDSTADVVSNDDIEALIASLGKMIIPEIVTPAGNFTKLKIALAYGADAVYAGVNNFSLRSRTAREFNYESFEEAIKYTHERGKKNLCYFKWFSFEFSN